MTNNEIQNYCCIATIMQWKKYHLHHCHPHLLHQEVQPLLGHPVMKTKRKKMGDLCQHIIPLVHSPLSQKNDLDLQRPFSWRAIVAWWWEHSPPTNVARVRFPDWRHMWVEFVGSLLCSERFFPGYSGFPLSSKTCISFNMIWLIWFVHMTPQALSFETHHV